MNDIEPSVTLWHGTTQAAAAQIDKLGWQPVDSQAVLEATARDHGVDPDAVREILSERGRFNVVQNDRDASAWFATERDAAVRWAQRAPEARWETLWAVWLLQHRIDDAGYAPWADPAASAFHFRQCLRDRPVVITAEVPLARLQDRYQVPLSGARLENTLGLIQTENVYVPEISVRFPAPSDWIVAVEEVPRRIETTSAAGLLGLSGDEISQQIDDGILPMPTRGEPLQDWYWDWHAFESVLTDRRSGK